MSKTEQQFQVGDRVRVVRPYPGSDSPSGIGDEGVVCEARNGHVELREDDGRRVTRFASRCELVSPAATSPAERKVEGTHQTFAERLAAFRLPVLGTVLGNGEPTDPYTQHRLSRSDETTRELTDARPGNVVARERNVAALARELGRPAPVRFPVPGRNFELKGRGES